MATALKDGLIPVGVIGAPRGLKGDLRVKSFTQNPKSIGAMGLLLNEAGTKTFDLSVIGQQKGLVLVRINGIDDRDAAEALKGQKLFAKREVFPQPNSDEYYFSDLVGLDVVLTDGQAFGTVANVDDFGGGAFIEVTSLNHGRVLVPFTKVAVPDVDIVGGKIVLDPPDGLLEPGDPEPFEPYESEPSGEGS